jgi:hypothetical protein
MKVTIFKETQKGDMGNYEQTTKTKLLRPVQSDLLQASKADKLTLFFVNNTKLSYGIYLLSANIITEFFLLHQPSFFADCTAVHSIVLQGDACDMYLAMAGCCVKLRECRRIYRLVAL